MTNMNQFRDVEQSIGELVADIRSHVATAPLAQREHLDHARGIEAALQRAREGKFSVAIVGAMNCGKSTLLNAMLGAEVVPFSPVACSAKLAVVSKAKLDASRVEFLSREDWTELQRRADSAGNARREGRRDDELDESDKAAEEILAMAQDSLGAEVYQWLGHAPKEVPNAQLAEYVAKGGRFTPVTSRVAVGGRFETLDDRQVFVDTPGLFDPVRSRELETQRNLAEAAAVVFVLYAGQAFSKEEVTFLKQRIVSVGFERIIIAINKIDVQHEARNAKAVQEYVRKRVREVVEQLRNEGVPDRLLKALENVEPIPVSGLMALVGRTQGTCQDAGFFEEQWSQSDWRFETYAQAIEQSSVPRLEAEITRMLLARDGRAMLADPLKKAEAFLLIRKAELAQAFGRNESQRGDLRRQAHDLEREVDHLNEAATYISRSGKQRLWEAVDQQMEGFSRRIERAANNNLTSSADSMKLQGDRAASRGTTYLAAELAYLARESADTIAESVRAELLRLKDELPIVVRQFGQEIAMRFALSVDAYHFARLGWVANARIPDFDPGQHSSPEDRRAWWERWTPFGRSEDDILREQIPGIVGEWVEARRREVGAYAETVRLAVKERYITPAVEQVVESLRDGVVLKKAAIVDSVDLSKANARLEALLAESKAMTDELEQVKQLLDRAKSIDEKVAAWSPASVGANGGLA